RRQPFTETAPATTTSWRLKTCWPCSIKMSATMSNFTSFQQCWASLRAAVHAGMTIPPWSAKGGSKTPVKILEVGDGSIDVEAGNGTARKVPRADFERIFEVWPQYKVGERNRKNLQEITFNSVYVISVLHWLETQPSPGKQEKFLA